jgi:rare lipoprotein A
MKQTGFVALIAVLMTSASATSRRAPDPPGTSPRSIVVAEGLASYYGQAFHGKTTASGVPFDMDAMVAAHPAYPFGTVVRVTNLANGRSVQVRIVDRGPASGPRKDGVIIDLSQAAAAALGFVQDGRTRVRVEVLRLGG